MYIHLPTVQMREPDSHCLVACGEERSSVSPLAPVTLANASVALAQTVFLSENPAATRGGEREVPTNATFYYHLLPPLMSALCWALVTLEWGWEAEECKPHFSFPHCVSLLPGWSEPQCISGPH